MGNFISYKGIHLEYETYGSGIETILAFHGFGNHCSDFKILEPSIGKKYKIISFNLPYHGKSFIEESVPGKSMSKNDLKELIHLFLNQHHIKRIALMGYSLGGKIALQLIELFPEKIDAVFLFAPDGIKNNWSSFVTKNTIGKGIYKRIIHDPSRFFRLVKMLKEINLVHEKFSDFIHHSLSTPQKRQMVWDVWTCFRNINPNISKIQDTINGYNINIHLFFGKYDHVIPPSTGIFFMRRLKNKNALHIIEMGHVMLKEKLNDYLSKVLE
jgi:pimeloyl-ACP methyl ester carboxylesterase